MYQMVLCVCVCVCDCQRCLIRYCWTIKLFVKAKVCDVQHALLQSFKDIDRVNACGEGGGMCFLRNGFFTVFAFCKGI